MSTKRTAAKGLYQRGPFWLDWFKAGDGTLKSPNLYIFWYDEDGGRQRSTTAGSGDLAQAKAALDAHYLERSAGSNVCPTCGQHRNGASGFLVLQSIADYLVHKEDDKQRAYPLAHVTNYIAHTGELTLACERVNEEWIARFRKWLEPQPIVSPTGKTRPRALSTVENSVIHLAAAINFSHRRGDTSRPALFKPIQTTAVNRTPQHRSDIAELAAMFRYATDPRLARRRAPLHRFLIASVATLGRPDAVHDMSFAPALQQWNSGARVFNLNPKGRRQTKKYRPVVPIAWQAALHFDAAEGFFVGVASVKSAWESMVEELGLPRQGEAGLKLMRRSMAQLLRDRLPQGDWTELELFLGHRKFDAVSDLYAPFSPKYLSAARTAIEGIIDDIAKLAPSAFRRSFAEVGAEIVPILGAKIRA